MSDETYAINARGIKKSFGDVKVLTGINLRVKRGTIVAMLGPNGAGKTTMVRILSTLLQPDSGSANIEGYDIISQAHEVRSVIGLTGQSAAVDEYLTGKENMVMMGRLYHLNKKDTARRAEALLKQFDLVDAADRPAKTYSGGMRRRLDLAISLIASPPVIFLDEPTTGLDPRSRISMWDSIVKLAKSGSTILLTTQYLEEADQLADHIIVIDGGKVIAEGTADELKQKVGKERIEVSFDTDKDFEKAKAIISSKSMRSDEKRKTVSIANENGVRTLKALLEKLDTGNIRVSSLSLHKPTLDDVFLKLTGHGAAADEDTEEPVKGKGKKK